MNIILTNFILINFILINVILVNFGCIYDILINVILMNVILMNFILMNVILPNIIISTAVNYECKVFIPSSLGVDIIKLFSPLLILETSKIECLSFKCLYRYSNGCEKGLHITASVTDYRNYNSESTTL
jgi:hypothetical protein